MNFNGRLLAILACISVLFLSGCGTPSFKYSDDNFEIKRLKFDKEVSKLKYNFVEGMLYCGAEIPKTFLFVTHIGAPHCKPVVDDTKETSICLMCIGGGTCHSSTGLLGRVDFIPDVNATIVELRRIKHPNSQWVNETFSIWESVLNGDLKVCEKK